MLAHGYADAFPIAYQEDFPATQAVLDIERIERLDPAGDLSLSLYVPHASPDDDLAFKLAAVAASRCCSRTCCRCSRTWASTVTNERPYEIHRRDCPPVWIYDFGLRRDEGEDLAPDEVRERFQDAFARAWRGEIENDGFNKLVLSRRARGARDRRAPRGRQVPAPDGDAVQPRSTWRRRSPRIPRSRANLVELFEARLDPLRTSARGGRRSSARSSRRSTRSRASTRIASCAASSR